MADAKKRGRPRTRPEGAKERGVFLTDEEFAAVRAAARACGGAAASWMRRQILAAVRRVNSRRK
jgi:hypothetical protein